MADKPFIIEDWAGNRKFPNERFESFDDARGRIMDYAKAEIAASRMDESDFDGYCEDMYAIDTRES